MEPGKIKCRYLRGLRIRFAKLNNIEYSPAECYHKGDCRGTCPACDTELKYLEKSLREKVSRGEQIVWE
jgi:heterodisulfide reductase subunit C